MGDDGRREERIAQFQTLLETSIDGFFINVGGRFAYVNPALVRLLGADDPAQLLGREVYEFIAPSSLEAVKARVAEMLDSREPVQPLEERYLRLDGREIDVEVTAVAIVDGGAHGMLVTLRDISERKQAQHDREMLQDQLRQAQKMEALGTLAGGIAHDFNNTLASVVGHAEVLRTRLSSDPQAARSVDAILASVDSARGITRQVLTFARRGPAELHVLDLRATVRQALSLLQAGTPAGVTIQAELGEAPAHVRADAAQIHRVLLNLCGNAWQAMAGKPGHITLELAETHIPPSRAGREHLPAGRYVELRVRDDGPGMPADVRARVFDPFFTTKPPGEGTGLGLAVVDGIVREHGGRVRCQSRVGAGTCFHVLLPAISPEAAEAATPVASRRRSSVRPAPSEHPIRVLLVDDDASVLEVTSELLGLSGCEVTGVARPAEALEFLQRTPDGHDLLLTDLKMPGMTGIELAQRAREVSPGLPVLVSTGFADVEIEAEVAALDIGVLQKPLGLEAMMDAIYRAVARRGERCEAPRSTQPTPETR